MAWRAPKNRFDDASDEWAGERAVPHADPSERSRDATLPALHGVRFPRVLRPSLVGLIRAKVLSVRAVGQVHDALPTGVMRNDELGPRHLLLPLSLLQFVPAFPRGLTRNAEGRRDLRP